MQQASHLRLMKQNWISPLADRLLVGVRGDNGCGDVLARGGADMRVREFLRFVGTASGVGTSVQPFSTASCCVITKVYER